MATFTAYAARIEITSKYIGMVSVEVIAVEGCEETDYCEYVVDGGNFIVWQSAKGSEAMETAAFEAAKKFEEAA